MHQKKKTVSLQHRCLSVIRWWSGFSYYSVNESYHVHCNVWSFRLCYRSDALAIALRFAPYFVLFSDLSKIFTSADQHSAQTTHFLEKRTLCLPLPAVYIPETDKYSCLHSNRWEKMPTCCTNCHKLLQRIVVLETKLFAGLPKQTEHTADSHHGPPQHTAGESCESQQFIPSVEEQAETDRRTNR